MGNQHTSFASEAASLSLDQTSTLISLYADLNAEARWQEECRERSASIIIGANSIIVGIIAAFKLAFPFIVFCLVQYLLAEAGQRFILKYHAISDRRHASANGVLQIIGRSSGLGAQLDKVFADARNNQKERLKGNSSLWRKLVDADKKVRIHELWYNLHGSFKVVSVLLAALICVVDLQQELSYLRWAGDGAVALINAFAP